MEKLIEKALLRGEPMSGTDVDVDFMVRELDFEVSRWERYLQRVKDERDILKRGKVDPIESMQRLSKLYKEIATVGKNKSDDYMKSYRFGRG